MVCRAQTVFEAQPNRAKEEQISQFENNLIKQGLQNVVVSIGDSMLHVTFENRRFRDEVDAVEKVAEIFQQQPTLSYQALEFTLQNRGIPTLSGVLQRILIKENKDSSSVQLLPEQTRIADYNLWAQRFEQEKANNGNWRVEFEFEPQLLLALGARRDPILHQINLLPSANIYLWRGARLRFQGIIPISDELKNPEDQFWRPRLITLSQYVVLPKKILLSATLGYFTERRYGVALQASKFFGAKSRFLLQANAAYTGFGSFPQVINVDTPTRGWQFSNLNYFNYSIAGEYIIPSWNLRVRLAYQKALLNRKVVRAEVWRQFDELQLGFFLYRFTGESNYGFIVNIPLFPKRYGKPGRIHFKTSRFFNYTYHTTQFYATDFSAGEDLWRFYETLHPAFFNNRLQE